MHHEVVEFSFPRILDDSSNQAFSHTLVSTRRFNVDTLEHGGAPDELLGPGHPIDDKEPGTSDRFPLGPREITHVRCAVRFVPGSKLRFEPSYPAALFARLFDAPPIPQDGEISDITFARWYVVDMISHVARRDAPIRCASRPRRSLHRAPHSRRATCRSIQ